MKALNITVIGTGYVGLVTGSCLAELGHSIQFVGRDQKKLGMINSGKSPIFEHGLDQLLERNQKRISTTTDISRAVQNADLTFICVGTPSKGDGSIDYQQIDDVSLMIGQALHSSSKYTVVAVKSTVLPGTTENIVVPILERESEKRAYVDFGIAQNPEFLKEGTAIDDFFHADRIVIGVHDNRSRETLEELYQPLHVPLLITTLGTSEMIKYASNAFLATKISFANEIGNLCKKMNIDSYKVFEGVGMDSRINPHFFRTGLGFGGSCFPKDVRALIAHARSLGVEPYILDAVMKANDDQPERMIELLKGYMTIPGKTIGILGLAYKPDTDDVRESRAIPIIQLLMDKGATIIAFDPAAMGNFKQIFPRISYADNAEEVLRADAVLITTEWREFENLDYRGKIVIDGRRNEKARSEAAIYEGVCW